MTLCLSGWGVVTLPLRAQDEKIDLDRATQLRQRVLRGEKLTEEDREYYERAKAHYYAKAKADAAGQRLTPKDSIGVTPLTDISAIGRYKGIDGGLYGGGRNHPPEKHLQAALLAANAIQPLDQQGTPAADGKIGLLSVGMSNTSQEFRAFMGLVQKDRDKSPSVVLVDGAQGGMDSTSWAFPERASRTGSPDPWVVLDRRLEQSGISAAQVQAAWVKQARANPALQGEFPLHAQELQANHMILMQKLKQRFPNLSIAYVSSRIYAGFATTTLNPEPYAYESAFAVRWLITDQIDGVRELNIEPTRGRVRVPVLVWGPYLWADGAKGRKDGKIVWKRKDLADDGTHPSASGQRQVAEELLRFFKTDATARIWFVRPSSTVGQLGK
jgi:hypothetical protein